MESTELLTVLKFKPSSLGRNECMFTYWEMFCRLLFGAHRLQLPALKTKAVYNKLRLSLFLNCCHAVFIHWFAASLQFASSEAEGDLECLYNAVFCISYLTTIRRISGGPALWLTLQKGTQH